MKISQIIKELDLELISGEKGLDNETNGVYSGDLLSVVMASAKEKQIWLTVQTHINIVAIASLIDISAILIVEGMEVEEDTIEKSNELGIPIIRTNKTTYEISIELYKLGIN
ncbi:serine kinase [Clostridium sp. D2Q-14]|uniref:DRTGG domain-containing protein n=1 Tax=Anaeromonas gelatinilytica TaxID=2683194 RepID=UPI00193C01BC|nr:DRTGG domain-containing protein [Anaeromonas gelatinilytica]MBS4535955.1 serine kinase [Anaeromonas gelatinilytica]